MKARVNDRFKYQLSQESELTIQDLGANQFQVSHKGKTVRVEVLDYDVRSKYWDLAIDGFTLRVCLEDELDSIVRLIQQKADTASGNHVVTAPIPGMIKSLHKQDGDPVREDEQILVLEAMKMENTILAPVAGEKLTYHVQSGERVGKGQPLFTLFRLGIGMK